MWAKWQKLELFVLTSVIFLIPANLSLQLYRTNANVHGILVDYLIPKLYLTDVLILLLLASWAIRSLLLYQRRRSKKPQPPQLPRPTLLLVLIIALSLLSAAVSTRPISAFWYLGKLTLLISFGAYLRHIFTKRRGRKNPLDWRVKPDIIATPLLLSVLFQSLIGLTQWIQKSSILGYYFLGESKLTLSSAIAKSTLFGELRPLPYGTTPHPNILSGFIIFGLLTFLILTKQSRRLPHYLLLFVTLIPALLCLFLAQSISAWLALLLTLVLLYLPIRWHKIWLFLFTIICATGLMLASNWQSESITRRIKLMEISTDMTIDAPLLGVGPNNFTAVMTQYGEIVGTIRFFQPVHNIYLLFISEFGLVVTVLVLLLIKRVVLSHRPTPSTHQLSKKSQVSNTKFQTLSPHHTASTHQLINSLTHPHFLPLLALLFIGLFDHYPTTLNTGQLLLVLGIVFWQSPGGKS